jgi:DUF438 domain-containing protein
MTITPKTTIRSLVDAHPFLVDFLAAYDPEFKRLTNPVLRRTMGRMATLERAAALSNVPLNALMIDIAAEVERVTGDRPMIADRPGEGYVDPARQEALKQIIRDLHDGRPMDELKQRFATLIEDVDASEIAAMEQALMAEGMSEQEVKRLCDVHVQVFADALEEHDKVSAPPGHPVDTFQRENEALLQVAASLRKVADAVGDPVDAAEWQRLAPAFGAAAERLFEIERHYLRKENQLFPFLERHGIEGPSKVVWALHDDIRAVMKELRGALAGGEAAGALRAARQLATMSDDMVNKEEKILLPMAMETLAESEWVSIRAGESDIGYALIAEPPAWPAATAAGPAPTADSDGGADLLPLDVGALSLEQLKLLLAALPLDYSFVDENDTVRFYSEGERIFPRSPGVIGRRVQNCHPPASVHKVQEILDAFRAGEKDTADFWITMAGRFLHIRYFACRDAAGAYRGVVETVQDVTGIRALEGERRLLDW